MPAALETKSELVRRALAAGFDDCRIARAGSPAHAGEFRAWLEQGAAGEMDWIARGAEKRCDPELVLPGARSVVVLAMNYYQGDGKGRSQKDEGRSGANGRIARYALGDDYHDVMLEKLRELDERFSAR